MPSTRLFQAHSSAPSLPEPAPRRPAITNFWPRRRTDLNRVFRLDKTTGEVGACQYGLKEGAAAGVTLCYPPGEGQRPAPASEYGLVSSHHNGEGGVFRVDLRSGLMSICFVLNESSVVCTTPGSSKGTMTNPDLQKRAAATKALEAVRPGMKLGLGTGSTAAHFVDLLGARVAQGLAVVGVPRPPRRTRGAGRRPRHSADHAGGDPTSRTSLSTAPMNSTARCG